MFGLVQRELESEREAFHLVKRELELGHRRLRYYISISLCYVQVSHLLSSLHVDQVLQMRHNIK